MANGKGWTEISPDTRLSELTAGDLIEAIGWAVASYRAAGDVSEETEGRFAFRGEKPVLVEREVPGWKEMEAWGEWRSNWWGLKP